MTYWFGLTGVGLDGCLVGLGSVGLSQPSKPSQASNQATY